MTNEELETYLRSVGYSVENMTGNDQQIYIVIRNYTISSGSLAGKMCDVAIHRTSTVPYVFPPMIHTRPALVAMDMTRYRTQASGVGPDWQYWSRLLRTNPPTPKSIVAHIATILSEI